MTNQIKPMTREEVARVLSHSLQKLLDEADQNKIATAQTMSKEDIARVKAEGASVDWMPEWGVFLVRWV